MPPSFPSLVDTSVEETRFQRDGADRVTHDSDRWTDGRAGRHDQNLLVIAHGAERFGARRMSLSWRRKM